MDTSLRIDFRCKLYIDGYEALKAFYHKNNYDTLFINNEAILNREEETVLLGLNYLMYSENKKRFEQFLKGLKHLEQNLYSYHYICIGEEDDDKVEMVFNNFTRPPLELEFPY